MDCLNDTCRSPVACKGFGYCRQRNLRESALDELAAETQRLGLYNTTTPPAPER